MGINSILGRYLAKQLAFNFIAVLLMISGIVLLFEFIEILRQLANNEMATWDIIVKLAFSKMPRTINMILPFVMMIAAMITFWKLSKSNEFVVIRSAGVSIWGFLTPILFATLIIGLLNIFILNPLSAKMFEVYETISYRLDTKNPKAMVFSDKGLWIREAIGDKVIVLQAKSVRGEEEGLMLNRISILEMDRDAQLQERIEAYVGILSNQILDLKDVQIFQSGKPTQKLASLEYKTTLTEDRVKESFIEPDAISFWSLPSTIAFYEKAGFSAQKHKIKFLSLVVLPFLLCSMVLVAGIFALRPNNRKGGIMYLITSGISTGFVVYFLSELVYAFGASNMFPAFLSALAPTLIIALIGISVLLHLEDG